MSYSGISSPSPVNPTGPRIYALPQVSPNEAGDAESVRSTPGAYVVVTATDVVRTILAKHGATAYGVYALLETYCNQDGECWPSIATIAAACRLSERQVQRIIHALVEDGWLTRREVTNRFGMTDRVVYTLPQHTKPRTYGGDKGGDIGGDMTGPIVSPEVIPELIPEVITPPPSPPPGEPPANPKAPPFIDGFEAFYAAYPKKKARQDALKAWDKLKPDAALRSQIMRALDQQKRSWDWRKEHGRFIPHPATWLNGRRWLDEAGATGEEPTHDSTGRNLRTGWVGI